MFPLLMLASRLSPILKSVSGSGLSLKGKTKTTEASAQKQADEVETVLDKKGKEHAADSPTGKMIINMTKEQEAPEMFGGMDLNKIKSALDEDSPIGMPAEVKGGVYKQIFEVNKMMLGSLQRIEGTLKLMLNLEYERALAFQQADVQQNLIEGDTDPDIDDPESGPGRFRRGLSAAGSMLGGAYGKAKDKFTGSTFFKLLGLGAIIFAFNKYKDEIITAMAGILSYFADVYDVFKAEGIGAAFDKVLDDFKTIFLPKIEQMSMDLLNSIWGAISGAVTNWLFGNPDEEIKQQADTGAQSKKNAASIAAKMTGDVIFETANNKGIVGAEGITKEETNFLSGEVASTLAVMTKIAKESDGRIAWTGMNDLTALVQGGILRKPYTPSQILNANPVIDGVEYPDWRVLENINLNRMGGITQSMSDEKQKEIKKLLREKTELYQELAQWSSATIGNEPGLTSAAKPPAKFDQRKENNLKRINEEMAANAKALSNSGQTPDMPLMSGDYKVYDTSGYTDSTRTLNGMKITGTDRTSSSPSANFNPTTVVDNKKIIDAKEVHNHPMNPGNINVTALQLAKYNNMLATSGI